MPYHVGEKGSYGCSGYPAVKDDGTVMGCHDTKEKAQAQITAINISESQKGYKKPMKKYSIAENVPGCEGFAVLDDDGELDGCFATRAEAEAYLRAEQEDEMSDDDMMDKANELPTLTDEELDQVSKQSPCWKGYVQRGMKEKDGRMVPNCVPVEKMYQLAMMFEKAEIMEGDYVVVGKKDEALVGQVIHIMREGVLGIPGADKTIEASPESPAAMIRIFEQDDEGWWEPTDYFYGAKLSMYIKIDPLPLEPTLEDMNKAEGYAPPAGARAAARKAIKFKEDGKANGAGTAVGWTRARQLANGETLSLSTVKRMYSYFSRHEVDKKGKDWGNESNPSNGYVMWLAWGGDAGYAWSKRVVQAEMDKALFSNFGRDFSNTQQLTHIFKD